MLIFSIVFLILLFLFRSYDVFVHTGPVWQEGIIQLWGPFSNHEGTGGRESALKAIVESGTAEEDYLVTIWDPVSR